MAALYRCGLSGGTLETNNRLMNCMLYAIEEVSEIKVTPNAATTVQYFGDNSSGSAYYGSVSVAANVTYTVNLSLYPSARYIGVFAPSAGAGGKYIDIQVTWN